MITALLGKDVKLFFRNPLFAVITVLVLFASLGVYFLLPPTADDTLSLGLYIDGPVSSEQAAAFTQGLEAQRFDSEEALVDAVDRGDYPAGLVLSADALAAAATGKQAMVKVYYAPGTPSDLRQAYNDVLTIGVNHYALGAGSTLNFDEQTEVLGPDLLGKAIPIRNRLLPVLVLVLFMVELMGLATIIVEEIEQGTAAALFVTPLSVNQFLVGKAIKGTGLAFVEVLVIVSITGQIAAAPVPILVALLLGSLLITGVAFLAASVSNSMMSAVSWGLLAYVVLMIPALAVMFPGMARNWIAVIPSHYLVDTLHRSINFGASWGDVSTNLALLLAWGVGLVVLGSLAVRRRFS